MTQVFPNDGFPSQSLENASSDAECGRDRGVTLTSDACLGSSDVNTTRDFTATTSPPAVPLNTSTWREARAHGLLHRSFTSLWNV